VAKDAPAPDPTLDTLQRLMAAEQRLVAVEGQQQTHQAAMEQIMAVIKEHLADTGNDPYRIAKLEQVTQGLTQITEVLLLALQSTLPRRQG
jgi:hypothetical protein